MPIMMVDLLFGLFILATGCALGWWVCRRRADAEQAEPAGEVKHAREVLSRLHELATRVASDVGAHTDRVEAINDRLHGSSETKPETVVEAVAQLIEVNTRMQGQLGSAQEKMREQAFLVERHATAARTDALTGLANRRAFDEEMQKLLQRHDVFGETFSVIIFDIDHFKRFNDTYGHQAGDDVLRRMGELLHGGARPNDLVARYGGEEFAMILPRTPVADATRCAERVRQEIAGHAFPCHGQELRVTASLGVAEVLQGEAVSKLIDRADAALYTSKGAGRNCTHWHDGAAIHPLGTERESSARPLETPPADRKEDSGGKTVVGQITMSNRTEFCIILARRLAEWRRGGATPSVVMVRLDGFSAIVGRYGQRAGALVMKATAQFLNAAIRDMDMVAHYETETFAILFPGTWLANVVDIAERLREAIAQCRLPTDRGELKFTVSVGGARALESDDARRLLERVQESLDTATETGGNCSMFHNGTWSETVSAALQRAAE